MIDHALHTPRGWTVPGNRWDLLAEVDAEPCPVSVAVPYYRDQAGLDRLVAGLEAQDHPHELIELVVADDGSPEPPRLTTSLEHRVVRQPDRGFRAAAARNLGLAAASGKVVAFLDGDCVPEPGWLTALTRLPSLAPEALVVGRREHRWLSGPRAGEEIEAPAWLARGYAETADLLRADSTSWRFMISANLAGGRELLREIGGFDGSLIGYGGEDWELAHRAWLAGALLAHEPRAVVVHDGPDWAGRPEDHRAVKNAETLGLARRIAHPLTRPRGLGPADLTATLRSGDDLAAAVVCVDSLLAAYPRTLVAAPRAVVEALPADPRLVTALPDPVRPGPAYHLEIDQPVRLTSRLPGLLDELVHDPDAPGEITGAGVRLVSTRASARQRRWGVRLFPTAQVDDLAEPIEPEPDLEAWFGRW